MASPDKSSSASPLLDWVVANDDSFRSSSRITSLYSDFAASRASNPDGFAANVSAWRDALQRACRAGAAAQSADGNNTFVIRTGPTLVAALEKRGVGRPEGLRAVQEDSLEHKHWYRLEDFLQRKQSIYYKPWLGVQIPAAEDVFFALTIRMGLAEDRRLTREGDFVILRNVEEATDKLIARASAAGSSPTQLVYSLDTFVATFKDILGDDHILAMPEISILLAHLYRDKRAIDMNHSEKTGNTTIKFAATAGKQPDPIEEADDTIAHLRSLQNRLTKQSSDLQDRIDEAEQRAKSALKAGSNDAQKKKALVALRSKKAATQTLVQREASLAQVDQILASIDEAAGQKEIVKAMEMSAGALEQLNREVGGVERVQTAMDRVAEGRAEVDEVTQVLGEVSSATMAADEEEVDEELASMLRDMQPHDEPNKVDLPNVPKEEPAAGTEKQVEQARQRVDKLALQ